MSNTNSLITSFFNTPHPAKTNLHQGPVVSPPILLTQESIESLETLSLADHSPHESKGVSLQPRPIDPDDCIILLTPNQSSANNLDESIVLVENATEKCVSLEIDEDNSAIQSKAQTQTTLSGLFNVPANSSNDLNVKPETGGRGRRKAAIKASIQMTNILTPSRSQLSSPADPPGGGKVASIFLSSSEKRKLRQEEERRKELEEKKNREIESEKYEAFYKFATEPIVSSRSLPDSSFQHGPIPSEETLFYLWTSLQHVRQTETANRPFRQPLPLLDEPTQSIDYILESEDAKSYNFLRVASVVDDSWSDISDQIKVNISERDRESRISELVEMFPNLPVRELYSHHRSLTCHSPAEGEAGVSSADSKKRTRQRDMDSALSFRSKRRRNHSSSVSSDDSTAECLIVDSHSLSTASSQEWALWSEKYLPPAPGLLLSDPSAVSAMKSFLSAWKEGCSEKERPVESGTDSCAGTPRQARSSDDEDFEMFLKKHKVVFSEDTSESQSSSDASLAGTMLAIGGVAAGKTAAVYAIAREMGLKVLEINTIMNRSGKDLQLILSEATQSFRVSSSRSKNSKLKHSINANNSKQRYAEKRAGDGIFKSTALDFKSRDKTMDVEDAKSELTLTDNTVILLDEVDIMFETDKGFWSAFQQIARETKLPIFLTANETNDFEILPDIFTNYVSFSPTTLAKLTLFIHTILLAHDLDAPDRLALDMARFYWPDLRQLALFLQFWITPSLRKNSSKRKERKKRENILNFLRFFSFRNAGVLFNIHSLCTTYIPTPVSNYNKQVGSSKNKKLRRQYIARNIFSNLEIYKTKVMSNQPSSAVSSVRFGDGFNPDFSPEALSQFDQLLCGDMIRTASDCVTRQVESLAPSDILNQSFYDSISSNELKVDKEREWKTSLVGISDSILEERGDLSVRNFGEHYLPYLKLICVSEELRQMSNARRHFKHYLATSLNSVQIDLLSNANLAH